MCNVCYTLELSWAVVFSKFSISAWILQSPSLLILQLVSV